MPNLTNRYKIDTKNLPQNPYPCMIVPDADELWDEESYVSSSGMSWRTHLGSVQKLALYIA